LGLFKYLCTTLVPSEEKRYKPTVSSSVKEEEKTEHVEEREVCG
jgi:hypothetical protein